MYLEKKGGIRIVKKLLTILLAITITVPVCTPKVEAASPTLIVLTTEEVLAMIVTTVLVGAGLSASYVAEHKTAYVNRVINKLTLSMKDKLNSLATTFASNVNAATTYASQIAMKLTIPKDLTKEIINVILGNYLSIQSAYVVQNFPVSTDLIDAVNDVVKITSSYSLISRSYQIAGIDVTLQSNELYTGLAVNLPTVNATIGGITAGGALWARIMASMPDVDADTRRLTVVDTSLNWMTYAEALACFGEGTTLRSAINKDITLGENDLVLAVHMSSVLPFEIKSKVTSSYEALFTPPYTVGEYYDDVKHPFVTSATLSTSTIYVIDYTRANAYYSDSATFDSVINPAYLPQNGELNLQDEYTDEDGSLVLSTAVVAGLDDVYVDDMVVPPTTSDTDTDDVTDTVIVPAFPTFPILDSWDFGWDVSAAIKALSDWLAQLFQWLADVLKWLGAYIVSLLGLDKVLAVLKDILSAIRNLNFSDILNSLGITAFFNSIMEGISNIIKGIADIWNFLVNLIQLFFRSIAQLIEFITVEILYGFFTNLVNFITSLNMLTSVLPTPLDTISSIALQLTGTFTVLSIIRSLFELIRK